MSESTGEIVKSLVANTIISFAKLVGAIVSGSGSMLAETLHSFADCGNELLLLKGVHSAKRPPDATHPLGYGRAVYFYSFIVALLLFSGGGVFSIHEGIEKILHPEPVEDITIALVILGISIALEGYALVGNLREISKRRGKHTLWRYMRDTKDSSIIVVAGENAAAVVGVALAMAALALAKTTGDGRWDGVGSLAIGLVLVAVAAFLGREVKSLLVGEAADPEICKHFSEVALADPNVERVLNTITVQQGPGQVVLAGKLLMKPGLTTETIVETINRIERELEKRAPEVHWTFIEPDDTA